MSGTSNIANMLNSQMRISGLASGLDTETMVKKLISLESSRVDKAKQNRQLTAWKQDAYREVTSLLQGFYSTYFDILSPTNLTSASTFNAFKATYDGADTSSFITIKANSGAQAANYVIKNITTAKTAQFTGAVLSNANSAISGNYIANADISDISAANGNNKIAVNFNGTSKVITIKDNPADLADLQGDLQAKLDSAFGAGKITVGTSGTDGNGGKLTFATNTTNSLSVSSVTEAGALNEGFSTLGLTGVNTSNKINLSSKLSDIKDYFGTPLVPAAGGGDDIQFTINGQSFSFSSSTATLNSIMKAVNSNKDAGVTMAYDQLTDKISIKSLQTGAAAKIQISDTSGNLMASLGLNGVNQTGSDASMEMSTDGGLTFQTITRSSNSFTINNINYTLTGDTTTSINTVVSADPSKIVDLIKGFVSKYNEIVNTINTKLSEVRDTNYMPLTDEQKSAMSTADIAAWESRVKTGLLKNDSILESLMGNMRNALYGSVSGVFGILSSIGITTVKYNPRSTENGKLVIDEAKLSQAITNNPGQVVQLFTQSSQYSYGEAVGDPAKRTVRNAEAGLAWKLSDVLQNNIRTMTYGKGKGALLAKAGVIGDSSEYENLLSKELTDDDKKIDDLIIRLSNKEEYWYKKFAAMETAMGYMNQQSAWITQQFSSILGG